MKLNPIPQRNSTNRASIILYNNAKSFTISFMKFSVYEWSVAHATDYNLTRVIGLELRVEGKKRGCFHLDCRKEMPNCWTPIDRSTRANEPYAITGRAKSATLRNLQVASTPRRKHGCTKRRCLIYYIGFLSRSNDSWKKKKGKRKRMWDFCNDSIHLSYLFFVFFTDGLQVLFESPFSRARGRRFEIPPVSASSFICQRDSDCYTWADCTPIGTASLCIS